MHAVFVADHTDAFWRLAKVSQHLIVESRTCDPQQLPVSRCLACPGQCERIQGRGPKRATNDGQDWLVGLQSVALKSAVGIALEYLGIDRAAHHLKGGIRDQLLLRCGIGQQHKLGMLGAEAVGHARGHVGFVDHPRDSAGLCGENRRRHDVAADTEH